MQKNTCPPMKSKTIDTKLSVHFNMPISKALVCQIHQEKRLLLLVLKLVLLSKFFLWITMGHVIWGEEESFSVYCSLLCRGGKFLRCHQRHQACKTEASACCSS